MREETDFFISYTQADRAWAEWLAWELEAASYTSVLQAWDMPPGTAFAHAMHQAVQQARHTILVLSPAYLRSAMAEAEWRAGFVADPTGEARRLLPVRVEDCQPAGLLADRVYVDLVGLDEATSRTTLLNGVAAALRGHGRPASRPHFPKAGIGLVVDRPRFPTALPPVWNVPFRRNPAFTGRDDELARLVAALDQSKAVVVTQVLQGGGGVGKTALAVEYAYRQRALFDTVWWIRAQEAATLIGDYADLAVARGVVPAEQADQQSAAVAARRWLDDQDRWLLILDNAEAPDTSTGLRSPLHQVVGLLPQVPRGQVLITSRDSSWEQHADLAELEVFTLEEATAFLLARSGATDARAATAIAELLGGLPLALEQAGAYVRETRLPLSGYLDRLRQFPSLALSKGRPRDRDPTDTITTTWEVSLERVGSIPGALALLEACAFLGPEEIPRELFAQPLDPPVERLEVLADDPFALDAALAGVRRFGLVKANEHALVMHRLLQQVIRNRLNRTEQRRSAAAALRLVDAAFPSIDRYTDPDAWPAYAQLLPHVLAVSGHAEALEVETELLTELLNLAGLYLWQRADHEQARSLYERALTISEARLGADDRHVAACLNNLGLILYDQGDLAGARRLYERALPIVEARLGADHPNAAQTLNNLANVLANEGDIAGARSLYDRALAIREARLGADHPHTAQTIENVAILLYWEGDIVGARRLLERSLAIREARLGADHPVTARNLGNLAVNLYWEGDLVGARRLLERTLAIREAHLGADHPDTASSLSQLAVVLRDEGDLVGARQLEERALAIREVRLGADHRETAWSLSNVAVVLRAQGDLAGAHRLHERALAIREVRLGADHRETAWSLSELAMVLRDEGDFAGARGLLERALAIYQGRLSADHPDTASSLRKLAMVLRDEGDFAGARGLLERALAIYQGRLSADHSSSTRIRQRVAEVETELKNLT